MLDSRLMPRWPCKPRWSEMAWCLHAPGVLGGAVLALYRGRARGLPTLLGSGSLILLVGALILGVPGCGEDAPLHERRCADGVDNDSDGRTDCADSDCWGTPECPQAACGNGIADGVEECDGADLKGRTCQQLGYDGGSLACSSDCTLLVSGCTGDPVCGNGLIESGEQCDGDSMGPETCADLGYSSGVLTCDASCMYDLSACEGKLLAECYDYGDTSSGVSGTLTCASEVGIMQWDWYTIEVQAGSCVDIVVDNGSGAADLLALAEDADGLTSYGLAEDYSQLDDELTCAQDPWSGWGCPAATVEAQTTGTFHIYVAQWYDDAGLEPGTDTCSFGLSAYTLFVAINGDATSPTLIQDDQPL